MRAPDGKLYNRMRRIGFHGNDLDTLENFNSLSRRICAEKPDLKTAMQWLEDTKKAKRYYKLPIFLLGCILGAAGFCIFFGGTPMDAVCAGICGTILGLSDRFLDRFKTNPFFKTIVNSFLMAMVAYLTGTVGLADNTDAVIIGSLMYLVPGLLFTNAMRDIIFGDTNSGINRIVQVLLIAAAIALGTGAAWNLTNALWGLSVNMPAINHNLLIQIFASFIGCIGFFIVFNIHGPGGFLCAFGGAIVWAFYGLIAHLGGSELMCYFVSAIVAATYSEIMARVRKYPTISYLVVSIFPLIPGASIYYTTNYFVLGDMSGFAARGKHTIAIAGAIAVGILMVSTIVKLWTEYKSRHAHS
jgi:uncharacterized membrane protein YjjP (DUF1212 family)